ncbi:MAG: polyprenyl diphosphate synthase [Candidatus Saccharimonadales bacterium]
MSENHKQVPRHLGLILDGNRRWARENGLPQLEGHRKGYENAKRITEAALERGVEYISVFVFSTENWNRSEEEVKYLMNLLHKVVTSEVDEVHKKDIRVRFLGARDRLSNKILDGIDKAEEKTKNNTKGTVAFCLNYGGQREIVEATQKIIKAGLNPDELTEEKFSEYLYAPEIPPLDMVVRTSGEQRISNFMLWRAAYAEICFIDKHWPAFTEEDLDVVIAEYAKRQRRFGK